METSDKTTLATLNVFGSSATPRSQAAKNPVDTADVSKPAKSAAAQSVGGQSDLHLSAAQNVSPRPGGSKSAGVSGTSTTAQSVFTQPVTPVTIALRKGTTNTADQLLAASAILKQQLEDAPLSAKPEIYRALHDTLQEALLAQLQNSAGTAARGAAG